MSKYDPTFWEVNVDPVILESVLIAPDLLAWLLVTPEDERACREREQARDRAVELVRELIHTRLTPDQRRVINLYFYQGKTQAEIAEELHISQQAVSRHLFGVLRQGRRVGEVAIKSGRNYRDHPEVAQRLKAIVMDEAEKRKIRRLALDALAGGAGALVEDLTGPAADALSSLAQLPQYRFDILFGLLRLDLNERVEELLREFVAEGTKDEAVMATRALCGYRVVHIGAFEGDKATQDRVKQSCEIALEVP